MGMVVNAVDEWSFFCVCFLTINSFFFFSRENFFIFLKKDMEPERKRRARKVDVVVISDDEDDSNESENQEQEQEQTKSEETDKRYAEVRPDEIREEAFLLLNAYRERLSKHVADRISIQDSIHKACMAAREELDALEMRVSKALEAYFTAEDERIQRAMWDLRSCTEEDMLGAKTAAALQRARAELLSEQTYRMSVKQPDIAHMIELTAVNNLSRLPHRAPTDLKVRASSNGRIEVHFNHLNSDEQRVLTEKGIVDQISYIVSMQPENDKTTCEYPATPTAPGSNTIGFQLSHTVVTGKPYTVRVKAIYGQNDDNDPNSSEWSEPTTFVPTFARCCAWARPQENIAVERLYELIDPNTARKLGEDCFTTTVIGTATLPRNKDSVWSIVVHEAQKNMGKGVYVGVAPYDVDVNVPNQKKCGWYMYCLNQTLWSGPPFGYRSKKFSGSTGGVFLGEVSLLLNTTNKPASLAFKAGNWQGFYVAYKNIPMDKPLVPAVVIENVNTVVSISSTEPDIICLY